MTVPSEKAPKCPICQASIATEKARPPFCSARCQTIDLGNWLGESYRIPVPLPDRESDSPDEGDPGTAAALPGNPGRALGAKTSVLPSR
jgi:endogenous inhibitor of DNA gyrase (YacG/DUF329 family)